MRISMLMAAAALGSSLVAGSANASALVDKPLNPTHLIAAKSRACPPGTTWQPAQYFTRHNGFRHAGCYRW